MTKSNTADSIFSGKATQTRARILNVAQRQASISGIDVLTLGSLAKSCGLSKSGLNAHFGSKEALQLAVIDAVVEQFENKVVEPVLSNPPGIARLIALMSHWIAWSQHPDRPGGCQLIAASFDFDGLEGDVRDHLAGWISRWRDAITELVKQAHEGTARDQCSEELTSIAFGLYMAQHLERHLMNDETAPQRALDTWKNMLGHYDLIHQER